MEQAAITDRTARATGPRIVLLTYGSRGDVEPFVALGAGLRAAGHTVRLAAPAAFAPLAAAHGLEFAPLPGDPDDLAQAFADRAGLSWPRMIARMVEHVLPLAGAVFGAMARAAADAELIVHSFLMAEAGHTLARRLGVPDVSAQFFPVFLATKAFPAVALPDLPLGGPYRRTTHALNTAIFRFGGRLLYRKVRAANPDLPALAPWPFAGHGRTGTPLLFAYSPHVLPRPDDWPPEAQVTGYWALPPPPGWEPPQALARFLESGPPPLFFGPGSMRGERLQALLQLAVNAARARAQRLVLGVPEEALAADLRGQDVCPAGDVPYAWLFPRLRYILHHGGAGTTGAAAAAGVPSTAAPFSADQAFWARRIHRLGLGPAAPPARRLTPERLDAILKDALSNPAYAPRARALGAQMRGEDGVAEAIQLIHECLAAGPRRSPGRS